MLRTKISIELTPLPVIFFCDVVEAISFFVHLNNKLFNVGCHAETVTKLCFYLISSLITNHRCALKLSGLTVKKTCNKPSNRAACIALCSCFQSCFHEFVHCRILYREPCGSLTIQTTSLRSQHLDCRLPGLPTGSAQVTHWLPRRSPDQI